MMEQPLKLLDDLHQLTSGYNLWTAGNSIKLSITYVVHPKPGITHDGFESKSFTASTVGKGDVEQFSPLIKRAIKWCKKHKGRRIS